MKKLLLILLLPVLSFGAVAHNGTIITWGYGDLLKQILDGIASLT